MIFIFLLFKKKKKKENLFKSKHRLDFSWIQLDARGRQLLGYNETDLVNRSCYDLVHYDDLSYV